MHSKKPQETTTRGWRAKLGIGLLAASVLTGVAAEMAPSAPASATSFVSVQPNGSSWSSHGGIQMRSMGSSWT